MTYLRRGFRFARVLVGWFSDLYNYSWAFTTFACLFYCFVDGLQHTALSLLLIKTLGNMGNYVPFSTVTHTNCWYCAYNAEMLFWMTVLSRSYAECAILLSFSSCFHSFRCLDNEWGQYLGSLKHVLVSVRVNISYSEWFKKRDALLSLPFNFTFEYTTRKVKENRGGGGLEMDYISLWSMLIVMNYWMKT
jgi:hypothetical protein